MPLGKHSRKLVELRKALPQGTLTADGLLPIEGPILLEEAHRSGVEVVDVFIRGGRTLPPIVSGQLHELTPEVFKSIQTTEHSQGVIATVRPRRFTIAELLQPEPALVVVPCRIQDPGNAGTIVRIAEAFGATGCAALRGTVSFYNSKAVRATAGSLFRLPHIGGIDLEKLVDTLKGAGVGIVGTAPGSKQDIENWNWHNPTAVFIGNEGSGLNTRELSYCDAVLRIPHNPNVESLNSAIASAVILYQASQQRRAKSR
jgi:TrmH family RNA methyltransferase